MKSLDRTLKIILATAVIGALTHVTPAFAGKSERLRFEVCNELRTNGQLNWHGIATGTITDQYVGRGSSRSFHIKACFTTRAACQNWVKRIWWEIPALDELNNAFCKPA